MTMKSLKDSLILALQTERSNQMSNVVDEYMDIEKKDEVIRGVRKLPVFLMVCFIRTWVGILSKIGCVIWGLFYLIMLAIIIMYACQHMWECVMIALGMSFAAFLVSFSAVAVGMALEGIGDKIGEFLAS